MRAAVLGSPIAHSQSPTLHRAAYVAAGLTDWRYDAIELQPADFPAFFTHLGSDWAGLSLTMPLKDSVGTWVEHLDRAARLTGSINTIVFPQAPGATVAQVAGHNTDVFGITQALSRAQVTHLGQVLVLGAGATARSALVAAQRLGAEQFYVAARSPAKIEQLQVKLPAIEVRPLVLPADQPAFSALPAPMDAVICTLPAHAADQWAGSLSQTRGISADTALLDVAYHPWPSVLASSWPGPVISGAVMLLWQAVAQVKLMTGVEADHARMASAIGLRSY